MTSCKPRDGGSRLLQVNATGVMPVIFSSSLLALPTALERYLGNIPGLQQGARALAPNGPLYLPVSAAVLSEHMAQHLEPARGGWRTWAVCRALFMRGRTLLPLKMCVLWWNSQTSTFSHLSMACSLTKPWSFGS